MWRRLQFRTISETILQKQKKDKITQLLQTAAVVFFIKKVVPSILSDGDLHFCRHLNDVADF